MNALVDLNLRWALMSDGTFSDIVAYLAVKVNVSIKLTSLTRFSPCLVLNVFLLI